MLADSYVNRHFHLIVSLFTHRKHTRTHARTYVNVPQIITIELQFIKVLSFKTADYFIVCLFLLVPAKSRAYNNIGPQNSGVCQR